MSIIQDMARDHLWLHFAQISDQGPTIIERGDGCYVWDENGKKYLDALAGLFVTQIGHGRTELANAASKQAEQLGYFPIWGNAHPPAAQLAARIAELAPGDMDRVFFTSGGSEAVESAWKMARQYFLLKGEPDRVKVVARDTSYHGTTLGALSITGIPKYREPFDPMLVKQTTHVANTNALHCTMCHGSCNLMCADEIEAAILREGPETVAAVYLEPVQNSGGCFVPPDGYFQRVREICDRHGVLLVSDEVICAFGRIGTWFGGQKFDYLPDMITFAKGITSGYLPLGGVITRPFLADAFRESGGSFLHGITFGGHPVSCAVGLANLDVMQAERIVEHVADLQDYFRSGLESLLDIPICKEVRGTGYFYAIELMRDPDSMTKFTVEEGQKLVVDNLKPRLLDVGLLARADNRGDPILQYSPPLIAGTAEIDAMVEMSRKVLVDTCEELGY